VHVLKFFTASHNKKSVSSVERLLVKKLASKLETLSVRVLNKKKKSV